jgi:hypothetical protein
MVYRGRVENGVVVLSRRARLPEGTSVTVRALPPRGAARKRRLRIPTLYERLKPFIGIANDLPPDASLNVDHYLHGAPKRK